MKRVVGVKFRDSGKVYYFDPLDLTIEKMTALLLKLHAESYSAMLPKRLVW